MRHNGLAPIHALNWSSSWNNLWYATAKNFNYIKLILVTPSFYNCLIYKKLNILYNYNQAHKLGYLKQCWQSWNKINYLNYCIKLNYYFLIYKKWIICFIYLFYNTNFITLIKYKPVDCYRKSLLTNYLFLLNV